ncbi:hypothetical protein AC579_4515 [Pseudocercospora musae]|uniref:enoyl-[acyl-carrier-protein] reductase n=1 Tax=Pseudocercospora musae TaxID=113226 RepID=A0A139GVF7_9PEZI|nr:hypothetical protein AC579_4515 [Pseudocercospora musae]
MGALTTTARAALQTARHTTLPSTQKRHISAYGYEQAKCLTLSNFGEPKDVLKLHGHSISPPTGDLLTLKFLASPINPADINQIQGVYPTKPTWTTALGTPEPIAVGGNEGVAEVISTGGKVRGIERGDWVILKKQGFGTWRTHAQTTEENLLVIKDRVGLKPEQVGTVSVNPCTAYRMLKDFVHLKEGGWFMQNGANSGVGRAAIQLGKLWGYKSINVVRKRESGHEELVDDLKKLGADVVVTDEEVRSKGFRDQVKEFTNGGREKIRLGLNCVGGKLVNDMAKHLAPGSKMVTYGAMSKQPVELPMGLLIFKDISFNGFWVSRWSESNPDAKEACVKEILDLTRQGKFQDVPFDAVKWDRTTKQEELVDAVQGTLEGYRHVLLDESTLLSLNPGSGGVKNVQVSYNRRYRQCSACQLITAGYASDLAVLHDHPIVKEVEYSPRSSSRSEASKLKSHVGRNEVSFDRRGVVQRLANTAAAHSELHCVVRACPFKFFSAHSASGRAKLQVKKHAGVWSKRERALSPQSARPSDWQLPCGLLALRGRRSSIVGEL